MATLWRARGGGRAGTVGPSAVTGARLELVVLLLIGALCVDISGSYETNEYCRWETFNATCPSNSVILMRSARYGRMQRGRCLQRDYYLGCAADVIIHADSRCSGRRECSIGVPDATLHEVQPCPKDIMAYLEAAYECVPVASGAGRQCQSYKPLTVTLGSGYIASLVTEEEGYGTSFCPWVVRVDPGQRINMTVYDFSILTFKQDSPICQVYATIKERSRTRDVTVCGGSQRKRHIMVSDTNEVEVQIVSHPAQAARPYFLLRYEAVGCPNIAAPSGGWVQRRDDSLVVGCNGTTLKWHLVCKGSKWVGEIKNCSKGSHAWSLGQTWSDAGGFPYGLLISVAIGVILGIVLGTVMLAVVLICRRRRQTQKQTKTEALLKQNPPLPPGRAISQSTGNERTYPSTLEKNATLGGTAKNGGYAHIWELRQSSLPNTAIEQAGTLSVTESQPHLSGPAGPQSSKRGGRPDVPDYNSRMPSTGSSAGVYQLHRDHVYESPKSTRRDDEIYNANTVPYYHEFDASDVEVNEIAADTKYSAGDIHSRNNNLRGTFSIGDE